MSRKKKPAALIAGIAAALIGVSIIAVAVLAVAGIITIDKQVGSASADKAENEEPPAVIAEAKNKDLEWQTAELSSEDITATVETEAGSFVIKLYPGAAADRFALIAGEGSFASVGFSTLAENMFIQCPAISEETFGAEQNELGCIYGAVGFAMDGEEISDSLFAVTAKTLSGMSRAYIDEHGFPSQRAELYESLGGMPEYEGRVFIFGQVISGFEVLDSIAEGRTSGYTGGYAAENPVKIISVSINPSEVEESEPESEAEGQN